MQRIDRAIAGEGSDPLRSGGVDGDDPLARLCMIPATPDFKVAQWSV
jgi:hypothetical protein